MMRIINDTQPKVDFNKRITVELSLAELAVIAALTGDSNSARAADKVIMYNHELADFIIYNDVNSGIYHVAHDKVVKEVVGK